MNDVLKCFNVKIMFLVLVNNCSCNSTDHSTLRLQFNYLIRQMYCYSHTFSPDLLPPS